MEELYEKVFAILVIAIIISAILILPVFAAGDVSTVIESTWTSAAQQIKSVVDKVVFPALDMILAIAFFVKLGSCYFDYRKHNQLEFTAPVILFICLVFTLTVPFTFGPYSGYRGESRMNKTNFDLIPASESEVDLLYSNNERDGGAGLRRACPGRFRPGRK